MHPAMKKLAPLCSALALLAITARADTPGTIQGSEARLTDATNGKGWSVVAFGGKVAAFHADLRDTAFRDGYMLGLAAGQNTLRKVIARGSSQTVDAERYKRLADEQSSEFGPRAKQWAALDWPSLLNPWSERPAWLQKMIHDSKSGYDSVPAGIRDSVRQVDFDLSTKADGQRQEP